MVSAVIPLNVGHGVVAVVAQGGHLPVGGQHKARNALATFASNSRHSSPWAAKVYADARRRGKHHPHAVRILARAGCGSCGPAGTTT
jgi:hypothetical protein